MEQEMKAKLASRIAQWMKQYAAALSLPVLLALLFALQNAAFNAWLHVVPELYRRMYAVTFALGVLLFAPAIFIRPRWRFAYLAIVSVLASALLTAEYLYFSYDGGFLQISSFQLTGELSAVGGTALRLLSPRIAFFWAGPVLVLGAWLIMRWRKILHVKLAAWEKVLATVLVLAAVFGGYGTLLASEKRDAGNETQLYSMEYDLNSLVGKMGIANFFLEDAAKRVLTSGDVTEADRTFVEQWSSARPATTSTAASTFGLAKGRNLIFIQVESLENAVINTKLGDNEITPNLDALAKQGLYFSNYYSQVGIGNTADAEFSTLDSLYPLPDSVAFVDHAQNQYAALPQLLANNGYGTYVFHGDVPTFWNRANIYPNLGYQTWFMKSDFTSTRPIGITGLGDEDLFNQSLPRIEKLPQPFMATLITLSSHTPFILPNDLRTLPIPANSGLDDTQQQYLESVHYADQAIGDFITQLKQTGIYDHSLIVIFGDHGSYTGISSALHAESNDVASMNTSQVPLIVLAPGTSLQGERAIPGSHLDVYPTVAHLLGINTPPSALGQDLLATKTPVAVQRKSGTGGVSAILSSSVDYVASADGVFKNGSCLASDTRQPVAINQCQMLYDQQSAILRVSDTVVRGNMLATLLAHAATARSISSATSSRTTP
ncbi:MAG: LTA synthase family protein [Patescibacteria group bacterium]